MVDVGGGGLSGGRRGWLDGVGVRYGNSRLWHRSRSHHADLCAMVRAARRSARLIFEKLLLPVLCEGRREDVLLRVDGMAMHTGVHSWIYIVWVVWTIERVLPEIILRGLNLRIVHGRWLSLTAIEWPPTTTTPTMKGEKVGVGSCTRRAPYSGNRAPIHHLPCPAPPPSTLLTLSSYYDRSGCQNSVHY